MSKYVTQTEEPWMPVGATKAKDDFAKIAEENGWQIVKINRADKTIDLPKLTDGDIFIHQFPSYLPFEWEKQLITTVQKFGAKMVYLIHDIEPFRIEREENWEFELFNQAELLIVHNPKMKQQLKKVEINRPMISIGFFDYLTEIDKTEEVSGSQNQLNYAGSLSKANFILDSNFDFIFNVYGSKPQKWPEQLPKKIDYLGPFPPNQLAKQLINGFGLLWDDEPYHQYEQINSPHKLSLYLAAGLPVIIWSKAAMADTIKQLRLGFTIDSLSEINQIINDIDRAEYQNLVKNVQLIGKKIRNGQYSKLVLQRVESHFD